MDRNLIFILVNTLYPVTISFLKENESMLSTLTGKFITEDTLL